MTSEEWLKIEVLSASALKAATVLDSILRKQESQGVEAVSRFAQDFSSICGLVPGPLMDVEKDASQQTLQRLLDFSLEVHDWCLSRMPSGPFETEDDMLLARSALPIQIDLLRRAERLTEGMDVDLNAPILGSVSI